MCKYFNKLLLLILLPFLFAPVHEAEAIIPFEISISETAGKVSTWIQEKINLVQAKISSISESKIAKGIGDGVKKIKEVSNCVKAQYEVSATPCSEEDEKADRCAKLPDNCQKYVDKYPFLAGAIKVAGGVSKFLGGIKDSKVYEILKLTRSIADDTIKITRLDEIREKRVNELKDKGETKVAEINEKINIAKDDLDIIKKEMDDGPNAIEWARLEAEKINMEQYIIQLEASKVQTVQQTAQEIIKIDTRFAKSVERIAKRQAENIKKLAGLKSEVNERNKKKKEQKKGKNNNNSSSGDKTQDQAEDPVEIVNVAQQKYSADINTADTIIKSQERLENIQRDIVNTNIAGFNQFNAYIRSSTNPANNPDTSQKNSEATEGQSEAIQASVDNTLKQIDLIKEIIDVEITLLEAKTLDIIKEYKDYKIKRRYSGDNALVADVCNYKVSEDKSNNKPTNTENTGAADNNQASNNLAGVSEKAVSGNTEVPVQEDKSATGEEIAGGDDSENPEDEIPTI